MENLILLGHLLIALAIIGLILLQQGKGAEMGASFGAGSSQTLFGAGGSGNFFSKMTALFAFLFFVTSFTLAIMAKQKGAADVIDEVPAVVEDKSPATAPSVTVDEDLPEVAETEATDDELPETAQEPATEDSKKSEVPD